MSETNSEFNNNSATEIGKKYVEKTLAYYKLKALKSSSKNISRLVKGLLFGVFFIIMLLFLSISLAIYLGNSLNNIILGYLLVAGIYLIKIIIIFLFRKSIDKKILEMTNKFFN